MNVFRPLISQWVPCSFAVDLIPATSDPAPGSVIAWAPIFSPDTIGTRNRFFCSSDPHSFNGSDTRWLATKTVEQAGETRPLSSMPITIEKISQPRPPYSSLEEKTVRPTHEHPRSRP